MMLRQRHQLPSISLSAVLIAGKGEKSMATPEELKQRIDVLEDELEAARIAAQAAEQAQVTLAPQIAELEAEETAVPVIAPQPSVVHRILPTGQFQAPQQGTDSK
jgi:predicted Zn-dependent protease